MKEENRKYAELAYDLVKDAEAMGSRLPGSEGERKYADFMGKKLEEIGIKAKKEDLEKINHLRVAFVEKVDEFVFVLKQRKKNLVFHRVQALADSPMQVGLVLF